jgi:hypothetical protein
VCISLHNLALLSLVKNATAMRTLLLFQVSGKKKNQVASAHKVVIEVVLRAAAERTGGPNTLLKSSLHKTSLALIKTAIIPAPPLLLLNPLTPHQPLLVASASHASLSLMYTAAAQSWQLVELAHCCCTSTCCALTSSVCGCSKVRAQGCCNWY